MRGWLRLFALLLLVLPSVKPSAQASEVRLRYAYATRDNPTQMMLHFIDPINPSDAPQSMFIPISADHTLITAKPSPDGHSIALVMSGDTTWIQLFNIQTGMITEVAQLERLDDTASLERSIPAWSPDSQYLAFTGNSPGKPVGTYIYSVANHLFLTLKFPAEAILPYQLAWSQDSAYLAVASMDCVSPPCHNQIEIFSVPNLVLEATKIIDTTTGISGNICNLGWSPDGRYVSFVAACDENAASLYLHEIFVWDLTEAIITPVTSFTNPLPFDSRPTQTFSTVYDYVWFDPQTILVGVRNIEIDLGIGLLPNTLIVQTAAYQLSDAGKTVLLPQAAFDLVNSRLSNRLAYRLETIQAVTEGRDRPSIEIQNAVVQVTTFEGQDLKNVLNAPPGCDLEWAPDRDILAYTTMDSWLRSEAECTADGFVFVDAETSPVRMFSLDPHLKVVKVGWAFHRSERPLPHVHYSSASTARIRRTPPPTASSFVILK
jgi:hypothetical protein